MTAAIGVVASFTWVFATPAASASPAGCAAMQAQIATLQAQAAQLAAVGQPGPLNPDTSVSLGRAGAEDIVYAAHHYLCP